MLETFSIPWSLMYLGWKFLKVERRRWLTTQVTRYGRLNFKVKICISKSLTKQEQKTFIRSEAAMMSEWWIYLKTKYIWTYDNKDKEN